MIDLNELTPEQRKKLQEELRQQEKAEKEQRDREIDSYKQMVSDAVVSCFPRLQSISGQLATAKAEIRQMFKAALDLKAELYDVKDGQRSHTFMSQDGRFRIKMGYYVTDNYDDTAEAGVSMVKEHLDELSATSSQAAQAVALARELLARDQDGNPKMSRVVRLRKLAKESGCEKFIRGVEIILDAYQPVRSKEFVQAQCKDNTGAWINIPLGITEA